MASTGRGARRRSYSRASLAVAGGVALLGLGVIPGGAQTGDTTSTTADPDLEADKQLVEEAETAKAQQVDAANGKLDELNSALDALNSRVAEQGGLVDYANQRLAAAEQEATEAETDVATAESDLAVLKGEVGVMAVRAFVGNEADRAMAFVTSDPNEAIRMETMRAEVTQTDLDLVEVMRSAQDDLEVRRADAVAALADADRLRAESETALAALQQDQEAQAQVTSAAEDRLDHLLAERAALAAIGADLDNGKSIDDLAARLAGAPAPSGSGDNVPIPDTVSEADIADAGKGILVHVSIVDRVRQLLIDADAAGVNLAGGGYRSPAAQIATRINNCGSSNYAIYQMPASQCSPPTARPGMSNHEKGLAIDFTYNGRLITSQSGAGWNWLSANAARYGLENLPSEPWHWSVDGR